MKSRNAAIAFGLGELLFLGLMSGGVLWQFHDMNRAVGDLSDLKDPSPFRAALIGNLGRTHIAVQGLLRNDDASMRDLVTKGNKEFESSVPAFQQQNSKLFPKDAVDDILQAFLGFRKAIEHVLEVNAKRQVLRNKLDQDFSSIITRVTKDIRPLIRGNQPDAQERSEAALNIENQARAWQQVLIRSWAGGTMIDLSEMHEHENRGSTYFEQYTRMQLLSREKKVLKEIRKIWDECGDLMPATLALERIVKESESFMNAQRDLVVNILNKFLPALSPAEMESRKNNLVWSVRLHGLVAALFTLMGLVSVYFAVKSVGSALRSGRPSTSRSAQGDGPMIRMSLKGVLTGWSAEAEKLYGYSSDEILGETIDMLFESSEDIQRLYAQLTKSQQTAFQSVHKAKSGRLLKVRVEFKTVSDAHGHVSAIGITCKAV